MSDVNRIILKQGLSFGLLKYVSFAISFFGQLCLVRLLFPDDFGKYVVLVALVEVVCAFTLSGIQNAAIKYEKLPFIIENSFGLALVGAVVTILVSLIILLSSQTLFDFEYANGAFIVLALTKSLAGLTSVYVAFLLRGMNFVALGISDIVSNICGMGVAIIMAFMGFGFLALVVRETVMCLVKLFWVMSIAKIKLKFRFDISVLKKLAAFIRSIIALTISGVVVFRSPSLIFGMFETKTFVGLYDRTYYLNQVPNTLLSPIISNFTFTLFSKLRDDVKKITKIFETQLFLLSRLLLPFFVILVCYQDLIVLIFGVQWEDITEKLKYLALLTLALPLLNMTMQYMLSIDKVWHVIVVSLTSLGCFLSSYALLKFGYGEIQNVFYIFSSSLFIGTLWIVTTLFDGKLSKSCYEIFALYISILMAPTMHLYIIGIFVVFDIFYNQGLYVRLFRMGKLIVSRPT